MLNEGQMSPIPTRPFKKIHGNYCGKGNQGGEPVDALDHACKKHDTGYHYTENHPRKDQLRKKHDASFVKHVDSIAKDKSTPLTTKLKAHVIKHYFKRKLKTN